jgi:hypothetical protein
MLCVVFINYIVFVERLRVVNVILLKLCCFWDLVPVRRSARSKFAEFKVRDDSMDDVSCICEIDRVSPASEGRVFVEP